MKGEYGNMRIWSLGIWNLESDLRLLAVSLSSVLGYLLSFFQCCLSFAYAQQPIVSQSFYGQAHTPRGHLHMLVVFIRYEDKWQGQPSVREWPDSSHPDSLPEMARGATNGWFCADSAATAEATRQGIKNISTFFYSVSGGTFLVTGEVFPVQVPVKFVPLKGGNTFSRQTEMNQAAFNWIGVNYPAFDWSRFDRRKNAPNYAFDNSLSQPDHVLDYVVCMHRSLGGSAGIGSAGNFTIPGTSYSLNHGHTGIYSYADADHNRLFFTHEFAHNLYGAPHTGGANGADGNRFYIQYGWGVMTHWYPAFETANAWEAWWLGWQQPQQPAADGRYRLRDFVTGQDAMRIQLPNNNSLWLENHQLIGPTDRKTFFDQGFELQQSGKGVYATVVAAPGNDRRQPNLNAFNKSHVNMARSMHGAGNWDFYFRNDSFQTQYILAPVMERVRLNPIAGQNSFQGIKWDYNHDKRVDAGMLHGNADGRTRDTHDLFAEYFNGAPHYVLRSSGDSTAPFKTGTVIGLSGLMPATTYPAFNRKAQQLEPYVLSGVTVSIAGYEPDGTALLDILLNDWEIRTPQRWCSHITLPTDSTLRRTLDIRSQLLLDLSGTPERETLHPETGTFANPTVFTVPAGWDIVVQKGATLTLDKHSSIVLQGDSRIVIMRGGTLHLQGGMLETEAATQLVVKRGGRVIR